MAKRGRKPLPTNILRLRGSRRVADRPKNEPKPVQGMPNPPDWLKGEGLAEWMRKSKLLYEQGTLTLIDDTALGAYCMTYAIYIDALNKFYNSETGEMELTIKTTNGNIIQNPILSVINQAKDKMVKLAAEFGMTPSGRTGINVPKAPKELTAAQKWIEKQKA